MGTRSAAKIKLRTAPYKCEICGRRLMSADALKSHQICVHNVSVKAKTKNAPTKQGVIKPKCQVQSQKLKNEKNEKMVVKSKVAVKKLPSNKTVNKTPVKSEGKPAMKTNPDLDNANCEYECPKCNKIFRIYFSAHRHIQKSHCVNSFGDKVSPNSPQLIKPIVRKIATKCNKSSDSSHPQPCDAVQAEQEDLGFAVNYVCSGCKQQFLNLRLFDFHVAGLHCNSVESLFFPNSEIFQTWKNEMEAQTKVKYSILGKYSYKKMFRCTKLPEEIGSFDDTTSFLCPSGIVVQEFSKGTQVHYYKDHYAHDCGAYVLAEKYKKYSLTTLLKNAGAYTEKEDLKSEENSLYIQFKQLMECIILDAAKVNVETMKILIGKALDMTSVLNNTEEDPDSDTVTTKLIIENSITGDTAGEKRKIDINVDKSQPEPITKRFKTRINQLNPNSEISPNAPPGPLLQNTAIKIINSFSLADQDISKVVNEMDSDENKTNLLEKLDKHESEENKDILPNIKEEFEVTIKEEAEETDSPATFVDSYKNFVVKSCKNENEPVKYKSKSRLRNSVSPKPQNIAKESNIKYNKPTKQPKEDGTSPQIKSRLSSEAVTGVTRPVDYKYEVKERENDCNILILKI